MDREGKKGKDKGEGRTEAEIKKEEGEKGKGKNWMKTRGEEKKETKGEEKNEQETKNNRERIGIRSKKNKKTHFQTSPGSMKHKECSPID